MRTLDQQARPVPRPDGLRRIAGRRMQIVIGAGVLHRLERLVVRVVDDLVFRRHMPHHVVVFGDAVKHAGVAVG